ncbi:hypothetical protein RDI58_029794 [Solanum bulbocastanum]|uniref:Uncharacterized protein n=1 Tax=Solanum bulbocastanum TaxID=147425 RepID=A0AAN8SU48_SOLBU
MKAKGKGKETIPLLKQRTENSSRAKLSTTSNKKFR